jgi:hypothetical protein
MGTVRCGLLFPASARGVAVSERGGFQSAPASSRVARKLPVVGPIFNGLHLEESLSPASLSLPAAPFLLSEADEELPPVTVKVAVF